MPNSTRETDQIRKRGPVVRDGEINGKGGELVDVPMSERSAAAAAAELVVAAAAAMVDGRVECGRAICWSSGHLLQIFFISCDLIKIFKFV